MRRIYRDTLLEPSRDPDDVGGEIGRDPRHIPREDWDASGLPYQRGMQAIRAKCLDCAGGKPSEVRKCPAVECALWPLRMGSYPPHFGPIRKSQKPRGEQP